MKIHFSATDKIRVVIYLTPEAPVAVIAPVIPPKRDTRNIRPESAGKSGSEGKVFRKNRRRGHTEGKNSASELCNNGACNCAALLFGKIPVEEMLAKKSPQNIFCHIRIIISAVKYYVAAAEDLNKTICPKKE